MTRKNFAKGLLTILSPLTAFGAKKQDKVCYPVRNIWETPQGQYVLALRSELKRLDHWDDLKEDWQLVEDALKNGHLFFEVLSSRQEKTKMLYNVRPVFFEKTSIYGTEYVNVKLL